MVNRAQVAIFWKNWGDESSGEDKKEFDKLLNRICTIVRNDVFPRPWVYPDFREQFGLFSGASFVSQDSAGNFWESALRYKICEAETLLDLMAGVQCLLWAFHSTQHSGLTKIVERLNNVFELSPNVLAHIALSADGPILYRGGARILDDALIADNLEWLGQYPSALKNFREALSIFLSKDANKYRNLLDNLRFAVEQLLRDVLGNEKSLENQKEVLLPWMKGRGLHAQVINMYHDLLFKHFTIYQNDAVKHSEKYSPQEIEFMIYLTGTFMRLLIQASNQSVRFEAS
jgi:hypothetical protein